MNNKKIHYVIYKVTNNINGCIYIGKHKCRRLDDIYFGSGKLIKQAIAKYGIENFTFHLEIDLNNQEEMDLLEQAVVNEDFIKRPDVYNISCGGKNPCMYGKNNPFYGKKHPPEIIERIRQKNLGRKLSPLARQHIHEGLIERFSDKNARLKCATLTGKIKCINIHTNEIKMFKKDNIPEGFIRYERIKIHVSDKQKQINKQKLRERCKNSKWYTDGIHEHSVLKEHNLKDLHQEDYLQLMLGENTQLKQLRK